MQFVCFSPCNYNKYFCNRLQSKSNCSFASTDYFPKARNMSFAPGDRRCSSQCHWINISALPFHGSHYHNSRKRRYLERRQSHRGDDYKSNELNSSPYRKQNQNKPVAHQMREKQSDIKQIENRDITDRKEGRNKPEVRQKIENYVNGDHSIKEKSSRLWKRQFDENQIENHDSSDSEKDSNGRIIGGYQHPTRNKIILISGLANHITEYDIRQEVLTCGLMPKEIRIPRFKNTGASRGVAFVEFNTTSEAVRWMQMRKGAIVLQGQFPANIHYSKAKARSSTQSDWFCNMCGFQNFRRRYTCYRCQTSRFESDMGGDGSDEICAYATKTVMLRNLDALTTEMCVMSVLNSVIPDLVKTVCAVSIGRDEITSTSRGICYLGLESTADAAAMVDGVSKLSTSLAIDGRPVCLKYCKYNMGDRKQPYLQTDSMAFNTPSASDSAKTQPKSFQGYPQNTAQLNAKDGANQTNEVSSAAAVAYTAIQKVNKKTDCKASGYQYDPSTGLYHHPNSMYCWNSATQKYVYWDQEKQAYVPSENNSETSVKKRKRVEQDKVAVPSKVAKDMERWAKAFNQKKKYSYPSVNHDDPCVSKTDASSASSDIGILALKEKDSFSPNKNIYETKVQKNRKQAVPPLLKCGQESSAFAEDGAEFLDVTKLICKLCRRQFKSASVLAQHAIRSLLHKQNLEALKSEKEPDGSEKILYRDRAMERRKKYGNSKETEPSILKEKYFKLYKIADCTRSAQKISAENVGNKLLKGMGWTEGQGLGRVNQGMTDIIQVEQRSSTAGLGYSSSGQSYK